MSHQIASEKTKQNGFTLIEILLVMLITSTVMLAANAAFRQANMLWSRTEKQRPIYQNMRAFIDTLNNELLCLYLPNTDGDNNQSKPFTLSHISNNSVRLSFFTMNPVWNSSVLSSLPVKVSYEFRTDENSGEKVLLRTEQLYSGELAIAKEQAGEVVLKGLAAMTIYAADPESDSLSGVWKTDLQCGTIPPKAIKIEIKWPKDEQENYTFEAVIRIAAQGRIVPR